MTIAPYKNSLKMAEETIQLRKQIDGFSATKSNQNELIG